MIWEMVSVLSNGSVPLSEACLVHWNGVDRVPLAPLSLLFARELRQLQSQQQQSSTAVAAVISNESKSNESVPAAADDVVASWSSNLDELERLTTIAKASSDHRDLIELELQLERCVMDVLDLMTNGQNSRKRPLKVLWLVGRFTSSSSRPAGGGRGAGGDHDPQPPPHPVFFATKSRGEAIGSVAADQVRGGSVACDGLRSIVGLAAAAATVRLGDDDRDGSVAAAGLRSSSRLRVASVHRCERGDDGHVVAVLF